MSLLGLTKSSMFLSNMATLSSVICTTDLIQARYRRFRRQHRASSGPDYRLAWSTLCQTLKVPRFRILSLGLFAFPKMTNLYSRPMTQCAGRWTAPTSCWRRFIRKPLLPKIRRKLTSRRLKYYTRSPFSKYTTVIQTLFWYLMN